VKDLIPDPSLGPYETAPPLTFPASKYYSIPIIVKTDL
jgi:hypothetical protein